jgi:hypothetical protein
MPASRSTNFTTKERASGWLGPLAGLDDIENREIVPLPRLELRHFGRPACSQLPYRLRYHGSCYWIVFETVYFSDNRRVSKIFRDVTPCSRVAYYKYFGETICLPFMVDIVLSFRFKSKILYTILISSTCVVW